MAIVVYHKPEQVLAHLNISCQQLDSLSQTIFCVSRDGLEIQMVSEPIQWNKVRSVDFLYILDSGSLDHC